MAHTGPFVNEPDNRPCMPRTVPSSTALRRPSSARLTSARAVLRIASTVGLLALASLGCSESHRERRTWQASDHQLPEGYDEQAAAQQANVDPGLSLYAALCASCHGAEGRGDGPQRPPMARVPSFADASFQDGRTDEQIAEAIVRGRGGFMPGFGSRVSPEGVAALVRVVRAAGGR